MYFSLLILTKFTNYGMIIKIFTHLIFLLTVVIQEITTIAIKMYK